MKNYSSTLEEHPQTSLAGWLLRHLMVRLIIVTLIVTGIGYYYAYQKFQSEALSFLDKYVTTRGELESIPFQQAEKNTQIIRDAWLAALERSEQSLPEPAFGNLMQQDQDGVWRLRPDKVDTENKATVSILPRVNLDDRFKRQIVTAHQVVSDYGSAYRAQHYDTYIDLNVSDANIMYLPGIDYARNNTLAMLEEDLDTELGATPQRNPERNTFWSGVYFDKAAKQWMVSVITPVDYFGQYIGGVGQDVLIDKLIKRVYNVVIPGTHNLIISRQGQLIAHPQKSGLIESKNGKFMIAEENDSELKDIYQAALRATTDNPFTETSDGANILGIANIKSADWMFITVYPKHLLTTKASSSAFQILITGGITLLMEVIILGLMLRRHIARPLKDFIDATQKVSTSGYASDLTVNRNDELGQLGQAFADMAREVQHHRQHLEQQIEEQTAALLQRNHELEQTNIKMQRLGQEKVEILALAANNLKSPIAGIIGMVQGVKREAGSASEEVIVEKMDNIQRTAFRLEVILCNLLDMNSLETGGYTLKTSSVALHDVIFQSVTDHSALADEKSITLYNQASNVIQIAADPSALKQVLDNLISNAIKFSPFGQSIWIDTQIHEGYALCTVRDQGPGISPAEMPLLFQKFSRLSIRPTGGEDSTGLGLSIVKQLLETMGGTIRCDSVQGAGSAFTFSLPLAN
jgi:signal transduction histidine kinase